MLTAGNIRDVLLQFDTRFRRMHDPIAQKYVAKLCLLEACGWIEERLDKFYLWFGKLSLKDSRNIDSVHNHVERVYSFEYKEHIRKYLRLIIGLQGVEAFENGVDPAIFEPMVASLLALKDSRNSLAHTHVPGALTVIDSPSVTIQRFDLILRGLQHCRGVLREL
jgi:hypothetical protein